MEKKTLLPLRHLEITWPTRTVLRDYEFDDIFGYEHCGTLPNGDWIAFIPPNCIGIAD